MAATYPAPSLGTRLLLVEDDVNIRSALAEMLGDEGFTVATADNGRDALDQLRGGAPPDVIVLDLMMPVMDGWEFRVAQRADPLLAGIPLLAMSADLSAKARAIAADGYVRKPIDFPDLRIVLAHGGRPFWMEEAFFILRRHPNVWLDVSGIPPLKLLEYFPRLAEISGKVLWGTDWPSPGVKDLRHNIDQVLTLPLDDALRQAMLETNALKLFPAR